MITLKRKRLFAKIAILAVAAALTVSVTACGETSDTDTSSAMTSMVSTVSSGVDLTDAEAILKNLQQPESMEATMLADISMQQGSTSIGLQIHTDITSIQRKKIKTNASISMGGQELSSAESYIIGDGKEYTQYTNSNGAWTEQSLSAAQVNQQTELMADNSYLDGVENLKVLDQKETVNGVEATVIEGEMALSNLSTQLEGLGDFSDSQNAVAIRYYVDTNTMMPVKITMDIKDALTEAFSASSDTTANIQISTATMEITINKVNDAVADFDLPAEVTEAITSSSAAN